MHHKKPPSQRQLKIGELIKHSLSEIFQRGDYYFLDNKKQVFVTFSQVKISPDLKNATIYYSPLISDDKERIDRFFTEFKGDIKHSLTKKVNLRKSPDLYFKHDDSFDYADKIEKAIKTPTQDKE